MSDSRYVNRWAPGTRFLPPSGKPRWAPSAEVLEIIRRVTAKDLAELREKLDRKKRSESGES